MSKLDQLHSRPATMALSSRCDARHLATLALWFRKKEIIPSSTSELVRLTIETFAEFLSLQGEVDFIKEQSTATQLLKEMALLTNTIQKKNMLDALITEGRSNITLASVMTASNPITKAQIMGGTRSVSEGSPELLAAQAILEQKMGEDLQSRVEAEKVRSQGLFEGLGEVPPVE